MTMVLLIDGPLAGKLYPYEHGKPIIWEDARFEGDDYLNLTYTQVVTRYSMHSLVVFGRLMHFGTCEDELPYEPLNAMFWKLMTTPLAMEASEPGEIGPPFAMRGARHD